MRHERSRETTARPRERIPGLPRQCCQPRDQDPPPRTSILFRPIDILPKRHRQPCRTGPPSDTPLSFPSRATLFGTPLPLPNSSHTERLEIDPTLILECPLPRRYERPPRHTRDVPHGRAAPCDASLSVIHSKDAKYQR